MSWDINLYTELDGEIIDIPGTDFNYTHNINQMIREAGFSDWPYEVDGWDAQDLGIALAKSLEELTRDPKRFRAMNPKNGWGDYDTLVPVLQQIRELCAKYPSAKVHMWA